MKITLKKIDNAAYPVDEDKWSKIKNNSTFTADIRNVRNPGFHRKFFSMVRLVYDNLPEKFNYPTLEKFLDHVLFYAGYYTLYELPSGEGVVKIDSISYENMNQKAFEVVYERCISVILDHFLPIDREDLESEILIYGA